MPIKATRLKNEKGINASLTSNSSEYALRTQEGGTVVRFMTEPEDWWSCDIHFDDVRKASYPCVGLDDGCVACEEGMEARPQWFASVYSVDDDRPMVFQMPRTIVKAVVKKYERYNTITDRNFLFDKSGSGLKTEYEVEAMETSNIRGLNKMSPIDIGEFLNKMLDRAFNEDEAGGTVARRNTRGSGPAAGASRSRRRPPMDEDDFEDDDMDDEMEDDAPRRRRPAKRASAKSAPTKTTTPHRVVKKKRSAR